MQRVVDFWSNSYKSDKVAFWFELISFIFTIAASLTLAITAKDPNMAIVYPGFFIGSVTGVYAFWRRGLAWPLVLTGYFACVNVFGFGRAVAWW
jgi:hypothetical protein